jgi:hypothetical protein
MKLLSSVANKDFTDMMVINVFKLKYNSKLFFVARMACMAQE